jgi:hypothetical protein
VHLLLIATCAGNVCGFLKAIYVPDIRSLFIAYLVTAKGQNHEERSVSQGLISCMFAACKGTSVESVIFEICNEAGSRHDGKAKIFRHYAAALNIKVRRIEAKYHQPEICSFDEGDCKITNADLYIAYTGCVAPNELHSMPRKYYERLVSAIYKHVYLVSYAFAEPDLTERYDDFLNDAIRAMFATIKTESIDLK